MVLVRGDHRLNEIKLAQRLGRGLSPGERRRRSASGSALPASSGRSAPRFPSSRTPRSPRVGGYVCGANSPDAHLIGVEPGRDFQFEEMDVRSVEAGDTTDGGAEITIEPAIEVGNIFKLGTRYSEALGATFLDENGSRAPDRDGLVRHRPRAHRRCGRRAGSGRARNRLAARDRAVAGRARQPRAVARTRRPRLPTRSTASSPTPGSTPSTTTVRPGRGRSSPMRS